MQIFKLISDNMNSVKFAETEFQLHPKNSGKYAIFSPFITKETIHYNADYDVQKVVGGDKGKRGDGSWRDFFLNLNHHWYRELAYDTDDKTILQYFTDPSIRNKDRDDPWTIHEIDGIGYITQGHHRTTIAKFLHALGYLPHTIAGVHEVKFMDFDEESALRYTRLVRKIDELKRNTNNDYIIQIQVNNDEVSRTQIDNIETIVSRPIYTIVGDIVEEEIDGELVLLEQRTHYISIDDFEHEINIKINEIASSIRYRLLVFINKIKSKLAGFMNRKFPRIVHYFSES